MCQQKIYKLNFNKNNQKGAILIVVLSILFLISIIIISTSKLIITNNNIINIDLDRKYAFEIANLALNIAEKEIAEDIILKKIPFPDLISYDQNKYPVIFTQLLEGSPNNLEKISDGYNNNDKNEIYFEKIFTNNCIFDNNKIIINGLCSPAVIVDGIQYGGEDGVPSWERPDIFYSENNNKLNSREIDNNKLTNISYKNPRYIVEFLGITFPDRNILLRVTTRAWGKDKNNKVTLQSYLEINQE